jgi:hypothetical protein
MASTVVGWLNAHNALLDMLSCGVMWNVVRVNACSAVDGQHQLSFERWHSRHGQTEDPKSSIR